MCSENTQDIEIYAFFKVKKKGNKYRLYSELEDWTWNGDFYDNPYYKSIYTLKELKKEIINYTKDVYQ